MCDGKPATMVGTPGDDLLKGTGRDDVIVGLGGSDRIQAGAGNDTICGFDGDDMLIGGPGDDVIVGGSGSDWVGYGNVPPDNLNNGVEVDLAAGSATSLHGTDELVSIENVIGSAFHDTLFGTDGTNLIWGGGGGDRIYGGRATTASPVAQDPTASTARTAMTCWTDKGQRQPAGWRWRRSAAGMVGG